MADLNFQFGSSGKESKGSSLAGRIFLCLFATPFAVFGLFAIWGGIKKISDGKTGEGLGIMAFGLVFAAVGFGLMYFSITTALREKAAEEKWRTQTDGGSKIWLARPDWAAGKIKSTTAAQAKILFLMGVAFCGIGGVSTFAVIKQELPKGNHLALLVLVFPLAGIGLLAAFVRSVFQQRRFGDCTFELAQVPAPLGGTLDGLIQTERPFKLEQGLHLKLSCIQRTVSGSGKNRSVHESIQWQGEKVFRPDASLPATGLGGSGIPVHFKLPADQPEASLRGDSTIIWRVEAQAKMAGPDFTAMFEVPVFRVAGTAIAAEEDSDPTARLQMSVDEIRRDEHSKIQVNQVPGGREFYFPAARNVGAAIGLSCFFLVWTGIIFFFFRGNFRDDLIMVAAFSIADGFIFLWCLNLWVKSVRVIIGSDGVTATNRWLIFSRTRRFAADEIQRFDVRPGMTSGSKTYHNLKLIRQAGVVDHAALKARYEADGKPPPPSGFDPYGTTIAFGIASKPEADWLVHEMTRALGRKI